MKSRQGPLIIAHRGASGYLPEHTFAAKTLAHEMGADFLEQDVVASRDDELIVLHDIHLDRVTDVAARFPRRERADGRFYVRDFDLDELRTLRVWERLNADGSAVYPQRYPAKSGDFKLHTLKEEIEHVQKLNAASGREVGVYTEIKRPQWHRQEGVDIAPQMLEVFYACGYSQYDDPVYVQCFDAEEVRRLKHELGCPWKLVQLLGENQWGEADCDYDFLMTRAGLAQIAESADAIGPWVEQLYTADNNDAGRTSTGLTELAHELGLAVHPYTFRSDDLPAGFGSLDELVRYCVEDLQVDGLFTDFPDRVLDQIRNLRR